MNHPSDDAPGIIRGLTGGGRLPRRTLFKGAIGAGVALAVPLTATACAAPAPPTTGSGGDGGPITSGGDLLEPEVLTAEGGVLTTTLNCQVSDIAIGDITLRTMNYNGQIPGSTLRLNPGETLRLKLENDLTDDGQGRGMPGGGGGRGMMGSGGNQTNLHTHGLHVSPSGNSDNIFLDIEPGQTQDYEIKIPEDHWGGMNWYHPHRHGTVSLQVLGGMSGAIYITGPLDELPEIKAARTNVLLLQRIQTGPPMIVRMSQMHGNDFLSTSGWDTVFTTNGVVNPKITMQPGEVRRWQILNTDAIDYFELALVDESGNTIKDGLKFLARDGVTLPEVDARDEQIFAPGNRFDVLVQAPEAGGFTLTGRTAPGWGQPDVPFLTVEVSGDPVQMDLPTKLPAQLKPISAGEVTKKQTMKFGSWRNLMAVNGTRFQNGPDQVDLKVGTVQEWTVENLSDQDHAFHIHTNPFYVVAENGKAVDKPAYYDVYPIPPATGPDSPGSITIRMRPKGFKGKMVQHCHILPHEDAGMMGVVNLV